MFAFTMSGIFALLAIISLLWLFLLPKGFNKMLPGFGLGIFAMFTIIAFGASMFVSVPASYIGVVTTFGSVSGEPLAEGGHLVKPWASVTNVYVGVDAAETKAAQAASRDLQTVHSDLVINYTVDPAAVITLYRQQPDLRYEERVVNPALAEVFKSVVSVYTAEELITKREQVSSQIKDHLNTKLSQYHLLVQNINLTNFGFSKSFDASIEEKVTANQKAATAENNLKRTRFEAEQRIAQAEGEAKAIAIQSAAIEKSGGAGYVQLQAIAKWDGKLPTTTAGGALPFINVTGK